MNSVQTDELSDLIQEVLDTVVNLPKLTPAAERYAENQLKKLGFTMSQADEAASDYSEAVQEAYFGYVTEFQMTVVNRALGWMNNPVRN
jgi:hypothetical protein